MSISEEKKLSPVEIVKQQSDYLRGTIAEELTRDTDTFSKADQNLLKFHGTYQQDDRDARVHVEGAKSQRSYMFMVRVRIPGGKLTSAQLLAQLDLCEELANGTLRATTRQAIQFHGVVKGNLRATIKRINEIELSTLAACGDVERNIMCCPAPLNANPIRRQLQELTDRLAVHLAPRTTAYHEIWVRDPDTGDDLLVGGGSEGHEIEPMYGPTYLPRKFKTAVGLPEDNCVDMYANDLAFMAVCEGDRIVGYNVLVGGSFGVTPANKKTFPAVAKRLAYIRPEQVLDVAVAIIKVQRDFGNRADRKVARLKYLLADRGVPWFKSKVEEYYGQPLDDPHPTDVTGFDDHIGWHDQGDGRWFYGLNVENGRIKDEGDFRLKSALREICGTLAPQIRITPHQSLLFCDIAPEDRGRLEEILRRHGVPLSEEISTVRRWSMACVAWPTCGLAITESERVLPSMIDQLEAELARLGLSQEVFTLRMTGCPNGCARPYNCDIGLVGKAANKYTVFVGGRVLGDRLNFIFRDLVPTEEVVPTLVPLFVYFKQDRQEGETFGDFCHRKGADDLIAWTDAYATQTAS